MRLAQRARTCPACGRREPSDARWCGDCGAPLAVRALPTALHVPEAGDEAVEDAPVPVRVRLRRWLIAVLVVLLGLLAGVVTAPDVAGDADLLARLDDFTGRSSLLPPVDELQLLWRRPVDRLPEEGGEPLRLVELSERALIGDEVIALDAAAGSVALPAEAVPTRDGLLLLVDGTDVVRVDAATGDVVERLPVAGGDEWTPRGSARGWVAGAALFDSGDGVLGAVERDGRVRWVGAPDWTWDGTGDGTDWLVVTQPAGSVDRVLVVDGATGEVARDVGPAGAVHAPAVHGDTLVWVDPFGGVDRGLGHPVEVHGVRLDAAGRTWVATDLPPTSGVPEAVRVTAVSDSVAVAYWTAGEATTALWLSPEDGSLVGAASVVGTGRTRAGWPVTTVLGDALVHVDPVRGEVRLVGRDGVIRWTTPAVTGEGVAADGDLVLVHTPPRGTSLQSRIRVLDAATGRTRWDRVSDDTQQQHIVGVLGSHVGISARPWPAPVRDQSWFDLDTGRRRAGAGLASEALGATSGDVADLALLGRVQVGPTVRPVFTLPSGRVLGVDADRVTPSVASLLAGASTGNGLASATATVADDRLAVTVGAASLTATDPTDGTVRWRVEVPVALRQGLAVLLDDVVVGVGLDGVLHAWDRADGTRRWDGPGLGVSALTAGGDEVVVGTVDGAVVVFGPDGVVRQEVHAGSGVVEDIAVIAGRVIATVGQDVVGLGRGAAFVEPIDRVEVP